MDGIFRKSSKKQMQVTKTDIDGVIILDPTVHGDRRGYFAETWLERDFDRIIGATVHWVQENQSRSCRGVVRGLHFQRPPFAQAKLVRVVEGRVLDVALDIRSGSPTYGRWTAVELSADNMRQLYIPRGMAHGFSVLSEHATFIYKCDNYYAPEAEGGIRHDDPSLAIDWQIEPAEAILSPKDLLHPSFTDFTTPF